MPSPKPNRFQQAAAARAAETGRALEPSQALLVALDVDGQVAYEGDRPVSVVVYGSSYPFVIKDQLALVTIHERTYRLGTLDGRAVLHPDSLGQG